jgi:CelD/BcsL family acetyltransferase involved in cellulose biosynthesis
LQLQTDIAPVRSFASLEADWRALDADSESSFFQTWTWVGCLAEQRYPDPFLVRAILGGRTVGLALFNRRRGRLYLAESGEPAMDSPFIEHNGPLLARGAGHALGPMLRAAARLGGVRRLVLSGISPTLMAHAPGLAVRMQSRVAPVLDLEAVRAAGDLLATRSANTREQIRRSVRLYEKTGPLTLSRAETESDALSFLADLIHLHTDSWERRGKPGAFAGSFVREFHESLVIRALRAGQLDLQRIDAGLQTVGYLYNFRHRRHVHAYQSGLDDRTDAKGRKPGLTCHALAIKAAVRDGMSVYDFLAGDHRYKRSLANRTDELWWAELGRWWSPIALAATAKRRLDRVFPRA